VKLQRLQIIYKESSDCLETLGLSGNLIDFRYVSNYDYALGQIKLKIIQD